MITKRFFKTRDDCQVIFEIEVPGVRSVELALSSNDWQPIEMRRLKVGHFKLAMRLPVGQRTEFCYRLDGERWQDDPVSDDRVANPFGTTNSVVDTTRPGS